MIVTLVAGSAIGGPNAFKLPNLVLKVFHVTDDRRFTSRSKFDFSFLTSPCDFVELVIRGFLSRI